MSRISATAGFTDPGTSQNAGDLREVDLNQFLQLLVTELQNQDPLDPMDNSEILAQISQIREISATDQLSDTLGSVLLGQNMATASGLIGKHVNALTEELEDINGVVDRVSVVVDPTDQDSRSLRVHVGEHDIRLDNIREIVENDPST